MRPTTATHGVLDLVAAILADESTALFDPTIRDDLALSGAQALRVARRATPDAEAIRLPLLAPLAPAPTRPRLLSQVA